MACLGEVSIMVHPVFQAFADASLERLKVFDKSHVSGCCALHEVEAQPRFEGHCRRLRSLSQCLDAGGVCWNWPMPSLLVPAPSC